MSGCPPSAAISRASPAACRAGRVMTMPAPPSVLFRNFTRARSRRSGENRRRATGKELRAKRFAQRFGLMHGGDRRGALAAQHGATVAARDESAQPQLAAARESIGGKRRATAPRELLSERALGSGRERGVAVGEGRKRCNDVAPVRPAFERDGALTDGGEAVFGVEDRGDAIGEAEPLQACGGEDDRGVVTLVETVEPRVDVAA